jgi:hypothetical protein
VVKVIVSVDVHACTIYRARDMGPWLLGAFWSLPFQLIISLVRRANEAATEVADRVAVDMESQAHMEDTKQRMSSYLASMLSKLRGGNSLYPPYVPRLGTEAERSSEAVKRSCLQLYIACI